jgi:hypothetical protein
MLIGHLDNAASSCILAPNCLPVLFAVMSYLQVNSIHVRAVARSACRANTAPDDRWMIQQT